MLTNLYVILYSMEDILKNTHNESETVFCTPLTLNDFLSFPEKNKVIQVWDSMTVNKEWRVNNKQTEIRKILVYNILVYRTNVQLSGGQINSWLTGNLT